jgi:hypothetical protein
VNLYLLIIYQILKQIFIPCVRGLLPSLKVTKCLVTFIEWYFYASSPVQTEKTLEDQDTLLSQFNELKGPFADISPSSLNFPKFHSLQHISESTRIFGPPDNADTEVTEHQHRIEVKKPYQRTNKRNPLAQVVKFVERRTALEDRLGHRSTGINLSNVSKRPPLNSDYRHLSGPSGTYHINEVSSVFNIGDLELATRTFFHDIKFDGKGYRHHVNRKNLTRLTNPKVSSLSIIWQSVN